METVKADDAIKEEDDMDKHKCYISFKTEDIEYKLYIQNKLDVDMIDKSLDFPIDSYDEDYIMRRIRQDYLAGSTVTIFLIGKHSAENIWGENQIFIKKELQASLYNGDGNTRNGILGIVLPEMEERVYGGEYLCKECGGIHHHVYINDNTTIKEFSYNYYIPMMSKKCCWTEEDRYCVLVRWSDFCSEPEKYINKAFKKRKAPISNRVKVYPK